MHTYIKFGSLLKAQFHVVLTVSKRLRKESKFMQNNSIMLNSK